MQARNYTKAKTLYYLLHNYNTVVQLGFGGGFLWCPVSQLSFYANVPGGSLRTLLPRWVKWGLVRGKYFSAFQTTDLRPHWFYSIAPGGMSYIRTMPNWYGLYDRAVQEVDEYIMGDDHPRFIGSLPIIFPAFPGTRDVFVAFDFPFQTAQDANKTLNAGFSGYNTLLADDFEGAILAVQSIFDMPVTKACQDQAIAIVKHEAAKHGYTVSLQPAGVK